MPARDAMEFDANATKVLFEIRKISKAERDLRKALFDTSRAAEQGNEAAGRSFQRLLEQQAKMLNQKEELKRKLNDIRKANQATFGGMLGTLSKVGNVITGINQGLSLTQRLGDLVGKVFERWQQNFGRIVERAEQIDRSILSTLVGTGDLSELARVRAAMRSLTTDRSTGLDIFGSVSGGGPRLDLGRRLRLTRQVAGYEFTGENVKQLGEFAGVLAQIAPGKSVGDVLDLAAYTRAAAGRRAGVISGPEASKGMATLVKTGAATIEESLGLTLLALQQQNSTEMLGQLAEKLLQQGGGAGGNATQQAFFAADPRARLQMMLDPNVRRDLGSAIGGELRASLEKMPFDELNDSIRELIEVQREDYAERQRLNLRKTPEGAFARAEQAIRRAGEPLRIDELQGRPFKIFDDLIETLRSRLARSGLVSNAEEFVRGIMTDTKLKFDRAFKANLMPVGQLAENEPAGIALRATIAQELTSRFVANQYIPEFEKDAMLQAFSAAQQARRQAIAGAGAAPILDPFGRPLPEMDPGAQRLFGPVTVEKDAELERLERRQEQAKKERQTYEDKQFKLEAKRADVENLRLQLREAELNDASKRTLDDMKDKLARAQLAYDQEKKELDDQGRTLDEMDKKLERIAKALEKKAPQQQAPPGAIPQPAPELLANRWRRELLEQSGMRGVAARQRPAAPDAELALALIEQEEKDAGTVRQRLLEEGLRRLAAPAGGGFGAPVRSLVSPDVVARLRERAPGMLAARAQRDAFRRFAETESSAGGAFVTPEEERQKKLLALKDLEQRLGFAQSLMGAPAAMRARADLEGLLGLQGFGIDLEGKSSDYVTGLLKSISDQIGRLVQLQQKSQPGPTRRRNAQLE